MTRKLFPFRCFRLMALLAALTSLAGLPTSSQDLLQETIVRGLRWYFHWQRPLPAVKSLGCRAQGFTSSYYAHCDPGAVTLDLFKGKAGELNVSVIKTTNDDFDTGLRLYAMHQDVPGTESFLFHLDRKSFATYEVDEQVSRERMKATTGYMEGTLRFYEKRGYHVRCLFPLVSKADPFYEVYLVQGHLVNSVWLFPVMGATVRDYPEWTYDVPHHNIPETAQAHVANPTRWLASLPPSGGR